MVQHGEHGPLVSLRHILISAAGLAALVPQPALACRLALVLALDVSSSIDAEEYKLQTDGLAAALLAPEVQTAFFAAPSPVALAAYEWSGQWNQRVVLDWRLVETSADLFDAAEAIGGLSRVGISSPTGMGFGIGYGASVFAKGPVCDQRVLDVSGDGANNHGFPPALAYKHFPLSDVTVNALVIGGATDLATLVPWFQANVLKGPGAFVEVAEDHMDFERAMRRKLVREVSPKIVGTLRP